MYDAILKNLITNWEFFIKISFVIDDWNSSNKLLFLDMNCYYISKNWKYQEKLIKFEFLSDNYDDQNLKKIVKKNIFEQNLKTYFLIIIINNTDNNDIMWKKIADELNQLHDIK